MPQKNHCLVSDKGTTVCDGWKEAIPN
jgi:hypothetical protein